ncbi:DUF1353 domain-containing protein [Campylobacter sp. RM16192]|uniref:DUF1353 domain-containing protein n=1 Tax=Campylobacter sp. RM16192 TaxID=1660080 RepID=UPI0014514CB8|nr:DUF1353 domain-containing protein [Campylobacter sp. RM16192]QCD52511.1 putative protein (DUF1353 domain) [Campylobacter sp. RM16192]
MIKRPILKPVGKDKFELVEPYTYRGVEIPIGYKTNGANIPRIFWSIFPPNSPEYLSAIVVHDFMTEGNRTPKEYLRADTCLKDMMLELGVSKIKTWIFYISCRAYHVVRYGGV